MTKVLYTFLLCAENWKMSLKDLWVLLFFSSLKHSKVCCPKLIDQPLLQTQSFCLRPLKTPKKERAKETFTIQRKEKRETSKNSIRIYLHNPRILVLLLIFTNRFKRLARCDLRMGESVDGEHLLIIEYD